MFDNQPTEQILRWISQGQVLQQQSDAFRHWALSPETLMVAGFCSLEMQRAMELFHGFAPELQVSITEWVDGLLSVDYRESQEPEALNGRFHAVVLRGLSSEAGAPSCCKIRCNQARTWIATIDEPQSALSRHFDLELWGGVHALGKKVIEKAVVMGAEHPLLTQYDPRYCIIATLILCLANERGSCEVPVRSRIDPPRGASAVVEVGLQRSLRVLWADADTFAALTHTPTELLFPSLEGVAAGRYAYYRSQLPAASGGLGDVRHDHYALQFADDFGAANSDPADNEGWIAWRAKSHHADPQQLTDALNQAEYVDVRLASGDVLLGCEPGDFIWTPYGRGTIQAYRIARQHQQGLDVHALGAFERYLAELMGSYPFVKISKTYNRSEDWSLKIVETRLQIELVTVYAYDHHGLICRAIQKMLWRLAQ